MNHIALLENPVRRYAWGSRTAIASLLGRPAPSERPEAELWLGAHPTAPSRVGGRSLCDVIRGDPDAVLGRRVRERFGAELPFLLKVLAAEQPLSLQAHPSAEQAAAGFAREQARGLAADAPERCYRDARAKPELIAALAPFEALVGFRPVAAILAALAELGLSELAAEVRALRDAPDARGLSRFFGALLALPADRGARVASEAAEAAAARAADRPELGCLLRLHELHPRDACVLAPLLLHRVALAPGEALFLPAGRLHAYLGGVGIEIMANSDNVLRGGLTAKHVDAAELGRVLDFEPAAPKPIEPRASSPDGAERVYATPAEEFRLSVIHLGGGGEYAPADRAAVEILLCTQGACRLVEAAGGEVALDRGASALVPARAGSYRVRAAGDAEGAVVYRATVPE